MIDIADIKNTLLILSAQPEEQIAHLLSLGLPGVPDQAGDQTTVDELALEFDDALIRYKSNLATPMPAVLRELDSLLDQMSNDEKLWTVASLRSAREWAQVRETARRCLDALDW